MLQVHMRRIEIVIEEHVFSRGLRWRGVARPVGSKVRSVYRGPRASWLFGASDTFPFGVLTVDASGGIGT